MIDAIPASFRVLYTKPAIDRVSTNRSTTRGKTELDTRLYLSADNKRCSPRQAARTSFGRSRRPALVAAANISMQPQHYRNRTQREAEQ